MYQYFLNYFLNKTLVRILKTNKPYINMLAASKNKTKGICSPSECPLFANGMNIKQNIMRHKNHPTYSFEAVIFFMTAFSENFLGIIVY